MFVRQVFRSAQPFSSSIRHYATPAPASSGSNAIFYGSVAAAVVGGGVGYYYLSKPSIKIASRQSAAESNPPLASDSTSSKSTFLGGEQGWVDLRLENVEELSHNTRKLRFALPSKDSVSGLKIASALLTKYQGPGMDKPVIRPYTPTSDEDAQGYIDLIVKKYPNGPMSSHLHDMEPDQRLEFKGPIPKYPWQPNKHKHIALIAGGTGITPMYQLCRAIFKNPDDKTKVTLVFGNVTEEDILLKRELEDLENQYPQRFRAFYSLDSPSESWIKGTGRITQDVLKTVLPEPKVENIKVFVCGPPGLYQAISGTKNSPADQGELSGYLKALGYSKDQVYKF